MSHLLQKLQKLSARLKGKDKTFIQQAGFTLIELSIVLVIIGLIVGGVLTGQDLIRAAEIRATVGQYEKYNAAVNTFRTKYNGIPGDLLFTTAQAFGLPCLSSTGTFPACTGTTAVTYGGDSNGLITDGAGTAGFNAPTGETLLIWSQLSAANLVDGSYGQTGITTTTGAASGTPIFTAYLPPAKLGRGNYWLAGSNSGLNYWAIAGVTALSATSYTTATGGALSPIEAFNIDTKLDDGMPNSGIVQATGYATMSTTADTIFNTSSGTAYPKWTSSTATAGDCVTGTSATATTNTYNRSSSFGTTPACTLRLRFN